MFPACLFGWFWFLFTFIPLIALYSVPINPMAVFYILCMAMTISATALAFPWTRAFAKNDQRERLVNFNTPWLRKAFYILSPMAIVCIMVNAVLNGFQFTFSLVAMLQSASNFIADRYSGNTASQILAQLGYASMYTAAVVGGLIVNRKSKSLFFERVFWLTFLPSALLLIIEGNKGALPLVAAMFWGGMLVQKLKAGEKSLFGPGSLRQGVMLFAVAFPLILFSFMARGLYEVNDPFLVFRSLTRLFASYSSAHLYAFSDWFTFVSGGQATQNFLDTGVTGGFYTFMSIFRIMGDTRIIPAGVYDEYFQYGFFVQTNIYTVFRGLITDFGLGGAFIVNVVFGAIIHFSFFGLLTKRVPAFHIAVFSHSIGMFYTSFIISLLTWNSTYVSLVGVVITLVVAQSLSTRAFNRLQPL